MAFQERSYIGAGKLYLGGLFVGNVPTLTLGFESEEITLVDKTQGGGGVYNGTFRISNVTFEFEFNDYIANNLSFALFGDYSAVTGGAVADEAMTAPTELDEDDMLVPWADGNIADVDQAVTVTGKVEGTDYDGMPGGLLIYAAGAISADDALVVGYTKLGTDLVQALVNSGQEYAMLFDGLNDAQNGDSVVVSIYRGKPSPASGLPLITDEHAANPVSGAILSDQTKTGVGISKYFTVALQNPSS